MKNKYMKRENVAQVDTYSGMENLHVYHFALR